MDSCSYCWRDTVVCIWYVLMADLEELGINILDLLQPTPGEIIKNPETQKYEYKPLDVENMDLAALLGSIITSKAKKTKKLGKIIKKFTTERGSKYNLHEGNITQRIWRSPEKHTDKTTGVQPATKGVFVKPNELHKLNPLQNPKTSTELLPPITHKGKNIARLRNTDTGEIVSELEVFGTPKKGLHPLEIFNSKSPKGSTARGKVHLGSKIISVD